MSKLFWFALFAVAAWYGWNHRDSLGGAPADEMVVINHSGGAIERVRIGVGGDVVVFESVEDGAKQTRPWRGRSRGVFFVQWSQRGRSGEREWRGNAFEPSGTPMVHTFEFATNAGVLSRSEQRSSSH